jgi:FtsH-binding integral membrane protein
MKSTRTTAEPAKSTITELKKPTTISGSKGKEITHLFDKENYKWMLIGLVVIAIGFILMAGGKSSNPNVFNEKEVYSFRRITLAPILIIAGFIIEIFAIMRKSRAEKI